MDDKIILYGFIAGFLLNAVIAAQMVGTLYTWKGFSLTEYRSTIGKARLLQVTPAR